MQVLNTGIVESKRQGIAKALSHVLADTYVLYLKTHKYHWNVKGPLFHSLHALFEEHYTALAQAVDEIAERIRVMGEESPGSFEEFSKISVLKGDPDHGVSAEQMVTKLLHDHEQVALRVKEVLKSCEGANDEGTVSLMGSRLEFHEKTAWMLKSLSIKD